MDALDLAELLGRQWVEADSQTTDIPAWNIFKWSMFWRHADETNW